MGGMIFGAVDCHGHCKARGIQRGTRRTELRTRWRECAGHTFEFL